MSLQLAMCMAPQFKCELRQTMHKKCDNCGEITDMGKWLSAYGTHTSCLSAVCWNCKEPLYPSTDETTIIISREI